MEHYDEVVIKTVRDLFRSYPLVQIKKYMMTKEGEINDKDNELKALILEKYTSLTNGIDGLEKISSNLNSLENIRTDFTKRINEIDFDKIELGLKNISFNDDFFDNINEKNIFNFEENNDKIEQFFNDKNYKEIIKIMITIKEFIDSENNNNADNDIDIKEKFYFNLVDLVEGIMNKMIEDNNICGNIEEYKILFDDIYEKLIKNNYDESMDYLIMSELYLKILYDKNIKKIIEEYFYFFNDKNKNYFSINILLKILFLKISQLLYDISTTSIELLFTDIIVDKYYSIYQIIMCIKYICEKYLIDNNENEKVDLNKFYSFIKSEINKNISSLLVIPKNLLQKIYIHETIIFWNNLYLKSNENEPNINNENLLEYLFLDKSMEQISNITSYTLKQYSINNLFNLKIILKNKNIKKENDIFLMISKLNEIKSDKLYKSKFIEIIQNKLYQFLCDLNNKINNEDINNENEDKIEYMNMITKIISYEELIKIFNDFNFKDIIQIINELIDKNQINDYLKIKKYVYDSFKLELLFELYINSEQRKKYKQYSISESLKQLIETIYEYEIKDKKHKKNIYLNIIDVYSTVLKDYLSKNGNNLLNNIIINDIYILKNINVGENDGNDIKNLIEQINNDFKIDINNIKDDINNYEGYKQLNDIFIYEEYTNNKTDFIFDFKNNINNNKQIKIEYLPIYVNKMHVFMLNKTKIDYSERENNTISTCNIYDYRIEENYLSIRQDKENYLSNKNESNVFGNITGKLFNFINDD
jgi:hypothetical protein